MIEEESENEGEGEREDEIEVEGEDFVVHDDHDDEAILQPTVQRKMKNKEKKKRENGLIVLARQPRMICMLCGVVTSGILISAFDAVSPLRKCSVLSADSLTNDFHHRPYLSSSKIASTGML